MDLELFEIHSDSNVDYLTHVWPRTELVDIGIPESVEVAIEDRVVCC